MAARGLPERCGPCDRLQNANARTALAVTREGDSAEHRRPRPRDGRSTLPCRDCGCQEKRRRALTASDRVVRIPRTSRRGDTPPAIAKPRAVAVQIAEAQGRRPDGNPATTAAGPTTMSDGRCSSACKIDGDWLRDTLSFRTLDAAGAKRYRGWLNPPPGAALAAAGSGDSSSNPARGSAVTGGGGLRDQVAGRSRPREPARPRVMGPRGSGDEGEDGRRSQVNAGGPRPNKRCARCRAEACARRRAKADDAGRHRAETVQSPRGGGGLSPRRTFHAGVRSQGRRLASLNAGDGAVHGPWTGENGLPGFEAGEATSDGPESPRQPRWRRTRPEHNVSWAASRRAGATLAAVEGEMAAAPKQRRDGWRRVARPSGRRSRTRSSRPRVIAGRWWEGGKSRWTVNAGGTTGQTLPALTSPCRKKAERAGRKRRR